MRAEYSFDYSKAVRGKYHNRLSAPLLTAIKLYELGRLSAGAAAGLAGIPKSLFLARLAVYGVNTFDLTEEELAQDLDNARRHQ